MSNNPSDVSSKDEPITVRDKIVQALEELTENKNEQDRVKTELEQENSTRLNAESQANHLHRQIQIAEANMDNITGKVDHTTTQLIEVLKVSEAARHMCTDLDNKLTTIRDREIKLDDEIRKAKESNIEIDRRVQEKANKLTELQGRIEQADRRSAIAQKRSEILEQDIRNAYVTLKNLMQMKEKARLRDEQYRKTIDDLQSRLQTAQKRSDEAETDVEKLQKKADQLQEKLAEERKKSQQIEKVINSTSNT